MKNGGRHLSSLRDGREVYNLGRRVGQLAASAAMVEGLAASDGGQSRALGAYFVPNRHLGL